MQKKETCIMERLDNCIWSQRPNTTPFPFEEVYTTQIGKVAYCVGIRFGNSQWGEFTYLIMAKVLPEKQKTLLERLSYPAELMTTREKIQIKNSLPMLGKDFVALEIYPPEKELINDANVYHLWVFSKSSFRPPFTIRGKGMQYSPQGTIVHEWMPITIDWGQKQNYKNQKFGFEACAIDILEDETDHIHFVCLPHTMSLPPELTF